MKRLDVRVLLGGLLIGAATLGVAAGCQTGSNPFVVVKNTITLDHERFRSAYEHAKTIYIRAVPIVEDLCKRPGCLTPERCAKAKAAHEEFKRLDLNAQTVLRSPDVAPNWNLIFKMLDAAAGIVL